VQVQAAEVQPPARQVRAPVRPLRRCADARARLRDLRTDPGFLPFTARPIFGRSFGAPVNYPLTAVAYFLNSTDRVVLHNS
jgi:hypothetical protein